MMDPKKFGNFLQTRRKELGLTQSRLGEMLGVTDKAISRWERGVGFPDISLLEPLADALEISVTELMHAERIGQEQIPAQTADEAVIQTVDLAQEQSQNRFRSRMLTLSLIPAVLLADLFLATVIDRYLDCPQWLRVLTVAVVSWGALFGILGIRFVASRRYEPHTGRSFPAMFWITTGLTCLGLSVVGIAVSVPGAKPQWFSLLVFLSAALALASPFYLYHLMTEELRQWNRWSEGRR